MATPLTVGIIAEGKHVRTTVPIRTEDDRVAARVNDRLMEHCNVPQPHRFKLGIAAATGVMFPFLADPKGLPRDYARSLHQDYGGEWAFDLRLKPLEGFPLYFGWIGAIF